MLLRKAITFTSAFFALKVLIDKLTSKVRFESMILEKQFLKDLSLDLDFVSLQFSQVYDDKFFPTHDHIALEGYIQRAGVGLMDKKDLKQHNKGPKLNKEGSFSRYELKKEDIEDLLANFNDPEIVFVIFEPSLFIDDVSFVAYKLLPADKDGNKMTLLQNTEPAHQEPVYAEAAMEGTVTAARRTESTVAALSSTLTYSATLNPSPPAVKSYSTTI